MKQLLFFIGICLAVISNAQQLQLQVLTSGHKTSLRGLSVVNNEIIWVSGSNGAVGKSVNGGRDWQWLQVKGFEKNDFRDIEAFDAQTAVIMAVGEPAFILKTTDGGINWKTVYENHTKGMFLDAMEFSNNNHGVVLGDPINGRFFLAETVDGGNTWKEFPVHLRPVADSGEACFAASGTNIRSWKKNEMIFVSGGRTSHLIFGTRKILLPIVQGRETTGANSVAVHKSLFRKKIVIAGGDFSNDTSAHLNYSYTYNKGNTWKFAQTPPHGYRSCIEFITKKSLITCGTKGVDYSNDGGKNWQLISTEGFHVVRKGKSGNAVFLAGGNGRIATIMNP